MLDEGCLQFGQELAKGGQAGAWAAPQLVTRELLAECQGPEAEWLSGSDGAPPGAPGALPPVPEDEAAEFGAGPGSPGSAAGSPTTPLHEPGCSSPSARELSGLEDSYGSLPSTLSSPDGAPLQPAPDAACAASAGGSPRQGGGFVNALHNPMYEGDAADACDTVAGGPSLEHELLVATPDGRSGAGGAPARMTPCGAPGADDAGATDAGAPPGSAGRAGLAERSRSLEAQLLGAAPSPLEAAALQQLRARLESLEVEVARLRDEKVAAEAQAAALLDEVQLSFAALEASQAARQVAEQQTAQACFALESALSEQRVLAQQLDGAQQQLGAALHKVEQLEYRVELMQAERQEVGGQVELHTTRSISPDMQLDPMAGGELLAEVALLRGQMAEANRSKAVLAGKLQQARADCAAMGARLAAGQARHAADLARSAAAAEEANAALRREAGALRAENQRLLAQAQLLARAAAAAGESERGAALAGIVRQREEQLTAAHLEVARLQVQLRESAEAQERCSALEGRVDLLVRQQEALADKLRAAQAESESWRGSLGKLSDELAACTAREAATKSALRDTSERLLVQQQLCAAQAEELDFLRSKVDRWSKASWSSQPLPTSFAPPPPQQGQEGHEPAAAGQAERPTAAEEEQRQQQPSADCSPLAPRHSGEGSSAFQPAGPGSEDGGTPGARRGGTATKFSSWLKFKSGH